VDDPNPPVRLFLGKLPLTLIRERYKNKMETWEAWNAVSESAQGN